MNKVYINLKDINSGVLNDIFKNQDLVSIEELVDKLEDYYAEIEKQQEEITRFPCGVRERDALVAATPRPLGNTAERPFRHGISREVQGPDRVLRCPFHLHLHGLRLGRGARQAYRTAAQPQHGERPPTRGIPTSGTHTRAGTRLPAHRRPRAAQRPDGGTPANLRECPTRLREERRQPPEQPLPQRVAHPLPITYGNIAIKNP